MMTLKKEEKEREKTSVKWNRSEQTKERGTDCNDSENTVPESSDKRKPSWADIVKTPTAKDKGNQICP